MSKGLVYCHICGKILERSENKQIIERDFDTKKEKLIFDLCPMCLERIKAMEVPKDNLKLRASNGKRVWTETQIGNYMNSSDMALFTSLEKLYTYQTEDEKRTKETKYDNAVGFNKPDSNFLSDMARKFISEDKKLDNFSEEQIQSTRDRMQKYITQLTVIANA